MKKQFIIIAHVGNSIPLLSEVIALIREREERELIKEKELIVIEGARRCDKTAIAQEMTLRAEEIRNLKFEEVNHEHYFNHISPTNPHERKSTNLKRRNK